MDFIELAKLNFGDFNRDLKKLVDECKQNVISVPRSSILALSLMQRIRDSLSIIEKTYSSRFVVSITLCREDDTNILIRVHDMLKQHDASEMCFNVFDDIISSDNDEEEGDNKPIEKIKTQKRKKKTNVESLLRKYTARFEKQKTCSEREFIFIQEYILRDTNVAKAVKIALALAASDINIIGNSKHFLESMNLPSNKTSMSACTTQHISKFFTRAFIMHPDIDEDFKQKIKNYLGEDYIKDIVTKYNAFITTKEEGKVA